MKRIIASALALFLLAACAGPMQTIQALPQRFAEVQPPVHYLDDTGCKDFPAGDYWNRPVTHAAVSPRSAVEIAYASHQNGATGAPNFNPSYHYAVVPTTQTLYAVKSTSEHVIPKWPIPSDMSSLVSGDNDHVSALVQQTSGACTGWDGYAFSGSGSSWRAYSGDHAAMNENMRNETCNGVAMLCGEDLEGDLTLYELNSGKPILHALHAEFPCSVAGTCGQAYADAFNAKWGCADSCARLRLNTALVKRPSNLQAAMLYDAMANYGLDTSENGCCWGVYTISRLDSGYPKTIPPAVRQFMSSLRLSDFQVLQNGSW